MNHQKLKYEEKRNTVLSRSDIKKMKKMRKIGATFEQIRKKFKVSQNTAWLHTASSKKVKEARIRKREKNRIYNHERYVNDPEFRRKLLISNNIYRKQRKVD